MSLTMYPEFLYNVPTYLSNRFPDPYWRRISLKDDGGFDGSHTTSSCYVGEERETTSLRYGGHRCTPMMNLLWMYQSLTGFTDN